MNTDSERPTGFYWIAGAGDDAEVARWDAEAGLWQVVGSEDALDPHGITVLGEQLDDPQA